MKKIFALAAIALFTITSCSDDDSNNTDTPAPSSIHPVKIIITENGESVTTDYTYDGNTLISSISSEGVVEDYIYSGDKITEINRTIDGVIIEKEVYSYDGDNLIEFMWYFYENENNPGVVTDIQKNEYTYNDDGTIFASQYVTLGSIENFELYFEGTLTLNNGNIVSYALEEGSDEITYTFDDKNSPEKNITSRYYFMIAALNGGNNNYINETTIENGEVLDFGSYTNTYTYNNDDYPVTHVETSLDGEVTTYEYFYE